MIKMDFYKDLQSEIGRDQQNQWLGPYNDNYPNVVITGRMIQNSYVRPIRSLDDLKSQLYYAGGRPRISSTPLGVNSLYNRFPYINQGSLQTMQI